MLSQLLQQRHLLIMRRSFELHTFPILGLSLFIVTIFLHTSMKSAIIKLGSSSAARCEYGKELYDLTASTQTGDCATIYHGHTSE
jgi:hypothetical protein